MQFFGIIESVTAEFCCLYTLSIIALRFAGTLNI